MAPIEDLQSRDLAWISDFVMQQMVIMLRPMMDHLQETDAACDYAQRMVQRLSMDVSEVRGDLERTNKYLAILRQGLGVQNEGKCVLQRTNEGTARTVKRLDDQMEGMLSVMRSVEDTVAQLTADGRGEKGRQEDLAKQTSATASALEDLQAKVERLTGEAHAMKDELLSNEAQVEVWQKELRELRRGQLGMVPKLEEKAGRAPPSSQGGRATAADPAPWPQKKTFAAPVEAIGAGPGGSAAAGGFAAASGGFGEANSSQGGSSQQSKRVSRGGNGSTAALKLPPQDHLEFGVVPPRSATHAAVRGGVEAAASQQGPGAEAEDAGFGGGGQAEESSTVGSRLPLLAAPRQSGGRPSDRGATEAAPRLRFTATMAKPESRGSPN